MAHLVRFLTFIALAFIHILPKVSASSSNLTEHTSTGSEWPSLSSQRAIALRTQRDISKNNTLLENVVIGVDLTPVVFQSTGYNSSSYPIIRELLNVGMQSFVLDLYYNEAFQDWGLCSGNSIEASDTNTLPAGSDYCETPTLFNITEVFDVINGFIVDTQNQLSSNIFYLLINLHSIYLTNEFFRTNISGLRAPLSSLNRLSNPSIVDLSGGKLLTLENFLFTSNLRILPIIISNNLYSNTTYNISSDLNNLAYISNETISSSIQSISSLNLVGEGANQVSNSSIAKFSFDSNTNPYSVSDFRDSQLNGYSPIISHRISNYSDDLSPYLKNSFWSWAANEPNKTIASSRLFKQDDDSDDFLNRCAIVTKAGWISQSCNSRYYAICVDSKNSTNYRKTKEKTSYFNANDTCSFDNEDGPTFMLFVPKTATEQNYIIGYIPEGEAGLWIDMNSLKSSNCWITDGVQANCPYQKVVSVKIFKQMITPASVIAFILALLIFLLQIDSVPVQKNRKWWKKMLNQKLKGEFEGVPA